MHGNRNVDNAEVDSNRSQWKNPGRTRDRRVMPRRGTDVRECASVTPSAFVLPELGLASAPSNRDAGACDSVCGTVNTLPYRGSPPVVSP
jgi:hypothetical protein